jgi:hypothetical protein
MQLPLSFAEEPSSQTESSPEIWETLDANQRNETLAVLARLLAKTAEANARSQVTQERKERDHD